MTEMSTGAQSWNRLAAGAQNQLRAAIVTTAVVGIVLGLVALFLPGTALIMVAILFGVFLIVAGISRIVAGATSKDLPGGLRAALVVLGVLILVAGIICLLRPGDGLLALAVVIGIGWILEGISALTSGIMRSTVGPRWLYIVGGIVSVLAGIAVLLMPGMALATFLIVGSILMIVVGIVALCGLPPKATAP